MSKTYLLAAVLTVSSLSGAYADSGQPASRQPAPTVATSATPEPGGWVRPEGGWARPTPALEAALAATFQSALANLASTPQHPETQTAANGSR